MNCHFTLLLTGDTPPTGHWNQCVLLWFLMTMSPARHATWHLGSSRVLCVLLHWTRGTARIGTHAVCLMPACQSSHSRSFFSLSLCHCKNHYFFAGQFVQGFCIVVSQLVDKTHLNHYDVCKQFTCSIQTCKLNVPRAVPPVVLSHTPEY